LPHGPSSARQAAREICEAHADYHIDIEEVTADTDENRRIVGLGDRGGQKLGPAPSRTTTLYDRRSGVA
jgi:hypothetical protein